MGAASNDIPWQPRIHPVFTRWREGDYGARGGPPGEFWRSHVLGDPDFQRVQVCVELVLGGDRVVRIASDEIASWKETGEKIVWTAGYQTEPEIDWSYNFAARSASSAARNVSLSIASDLVQPGELMARGRMIAGIGEVSLQVHNMPWEQRMVVMRGVTSGGVTVSAVTGGIVSLSLSDPKDLVDQVIGSSVLTAIAMSSESLAPLAGPWENAVGQKYPVVLNTATVPCLGADQFVTSPPYFIVCIGHDVTLGSFLWINGATGDGFDLWVFTQHQVWDSYGVPLTALRLDTSGTNPNYAFDPTGDTVHVDVTVNSHTDKTVLGMARTLLEDFTCVGRNGLSAELWGLAQSKLGPTAISTLINGAADDGTEAKALEFVESEILSSFPMIAMCWHGTGYGPIVTDHRLNEPRADIVAGQWPLHDEASSELQEMGQDECFNNFTLQYNYDVITDTYRSVKTRHKGNDAQCQRSAYSDIGERIMDTITSVHIVDDDVADYVLDWLVAHFTFPSSYVEYPCYPWLLVNLMLGEELRLTDPRWGFTQTVGTVERLYWSRSTGATLGIRTWHLYHPPVEVVSATPTHEDDDDDGAVVGAASITLGDLTVSSTGLATLPFVLLNFEADGITNEGAPGFSGITNKGTASFAGLINQSSGTNILSSTEKYTGATSGRFDASVGTTVSYSGSAMDLGVNPTAVWKFYYRPVATPTSFAHTMFCWGDGLTNRFLFAILPSLDAQIYCIRSGSTKFNILGGGGGVALNVWNEFMMVQDGAGGVEFFVNGVSIGTGSDGGIDWSDASFGQMTWGRESWTPDNYCDGYFDDFTIEL